MPSAPQPESFAALSRLAWLAPRVVQVAVAVPAPAWALPAARRHSPTSGVAVAAAEWRAVAVVRSPLHRRTDDETPH
ncbi:MAG TPA: hypothetical protein VHY35_16480 [Stellaceae bacterium]|nr:hypothetical protein [Stellaceae bacterium]